METHQNNWNKYMQTWSEQDSRKQLMLLKEILDDQATYIDPVTMDWLIGPESIQSYIQQNQNMIPGLNLRLKKYDQHHNSSLALWDMCNVEGAVLSSGSSFARYCSEGKIVETVAFFSAN